MSENEAFQELGEPVAIIGIACRFPEAPGCADLLELSLAGRRAFRRLPPARLDAAEYGEPVPGERVPGPRQPGMANLPRAALIEGWRFDRAAFAVTDTAYRAADPAHWLALETAARALADAGVPGGQGLVRDRTGVVVGNTLTGEVSRASAMRSRWPYVRRALHAALSAGDVPPEARARVLRDAAASFLAPFPEISDETLAGSLPSAIADRICGHFGFRGGGHTVDAAHSSSLLAVAAACSALAAGDLDAAVAGGVDISLDPFELAALARTGVLADREMRVYDARPTGFWPGEGCGLVVLMRAADARKANLPAYADIIGWGVSSAGNPALTRPGSGSLLFALRRAHQRAGIDPADVQFIEGDGAGTASGDLAELTSLAEIRSGAPGLAALGSVKANIGHAKAAAGAAGLIKTTLAVAAGVIPPTTGCDRPHPLIMSDDARVRIPHTPEPWPEGTRVAGISSVSPGGTSVHVIVRRGNGGRRRRGAPRAVRLPGGRAPTPGGGRSPQTARLTVRATPRVEAFTFSGPDHAALTAELTRIADLAPWLSDGEWHDLACQTGRRVAGPAAVRVSLVAGTQDQLSDLSREAVALLPALRPRSLVTAAGIFAANAARGRVTLLFPGEGALSANPAPCPGPGEAGTVDPALQPAVTQASLDGLRWLDRLGVVATAGVGHGLGETAGLVWAGCLSEPDAARLVSQRAALLAASRADLAALVCVDADEGTARSLCAASHLVITAYNGPRSHVLAGPQAAVRDLSRRLAQDGIPARVLDSPHALHSPAMADLVGRLRAELAELTFRPPARRLLSTVTGTELTSADDIPALLCAQLTSPVRFAGPLTLAAAEADLLVETGPGHGLSLLAADCCDVPAVSLGEGREEEKAAVAAALFAVGAVRSLAPALSGRPARPVDIWRERVFIASPCGAPPPAGILAMSERPAEGALARMTAGPDAREPSRGPQATTAAPLVAEAGARSWASPHPSAPHAAAGPDHTGRATPTIPRLPAPPGRNGTGQVWPVPGPGEATVAAPARPPTQDGTTPSEGGAPGAAAGTTPASAGYKSPIPGTEGMAVPAHTAPRAHSTAAGLRGVAPWVRVFTERLLPAEPPSRPVAAGAWRLRTATCHPFGRMAESIFDHDPAADCVLAVPGDPAEPDGCATLLEASREAVVVGSLAVIAPVDGLDGFCASLHAEHPSLGITLIRTAAGEEGLRAARRFAFTAPGRFRRVVLDEAGTAREPVMAVAEPAGGAPFPLGPADVVLVSGMATVGDLACAIALASRGAALAVIAPPGPEDPSLAALLADVRAEGTRVSRKKADPTDPGQVAAAVRSLERRLGPVTAIVHAAAAGPVGHCLQMPASALCNLVAGQQARLGTLVASVAMERVRLLVTFGSAAARYGRAGGSGDALTGGLLAAQASALAGGWPRCQLMHADLPPWQAPDPRAEPGAAAESPGDMLPVSAEDGSRLLVGALSTPGFPSRIAIHGRAGMPALQAPGHDRAALVRRGRFLETARVDYPGVELITDARLSLSSDPYLDDHRVDGLPVLPLAMALEAMAQCASALSGHAQRNPAEVTMPAPVVLAGGARGGDTLIRVCALRLGDTVETVLRCAETDFLVDHARAVFRGAGAPEHGRASAAATSGHEVTVLPPPSAGDATPGGIVDGTDLYGPVYFQGGRFRRVAFLRDVSSRFCGALVRGGDDQPWFGAAPGPVDTPLILGSPGLNDATLHVLQACIPHRRMLPTGCSSMAASGREVRGALVVHAVRRAAGGAGATRIAQDSVWDITAVDATGEPVVAWTGVRLLDVGPLARTAAWHPALLAACLESRAAELAIDPALRAVISSGLGHIQGGIHDPIVPGAGCAPGDVASRARAPDPIWTDTAPGRGPLDGLELTVRASRQVACHWEVVGMAQERELPDLGPRLRQRLGDRPHETPASADARLRTIATCLAALGHDPATPPVLEDACDGGWVVVRAGDAAVACAVVEISGIPDPVAVAMACRGARGVQEQHEANPGRSPGPRGQRSRSR